MPDIRQDADLRIRILQLVTTGGYLANPRLAKVHR